MIAEKVYASESQSHYYDRSGRPVHTQPNKSKPGEFRNTTLRDARVQDLLPSVSTILKVMSKDSLTPWIKKQVAKAAYNVPSLESQDEWVDYIVRKADEQMNVAREVGSEGHGAINRYFEHYMELGKEPLDYTDAHPGLINAVILALNEFGVSGVPMRTENSFASLLGYGGCVDLSGYSRHFEKPSFHWIVDFKVVDRLEKKLDYMDRCAQLCAYSRGLFPEEELSQVRLANIFVSSTDYTYFLREWSDEEKRKGWEIFSCCLNLHRAISGYYP